MTVPPETLAWLHQAARIDGATYAQVLLMILERLELLEDGAAQPPAAQSAPPVAPAGGLVERVAKAIHPSICADPNLYRHEARAAIREVAYFLGDLGYRAAKADLLEQVADRG